MIIGTAYFASLADANRYYGAEQAQEKLSEGAIYIGRPTPKEDERVVLTNEGRYCLEVKRGK